mgnify:CR=1 FL=1
MKNYTVQRIAASRILDTKLQQRVACMDTLKVEIVKEGALENSLIIVLCEFISILNQYIDLIQGLLDSGAAEKIPLSESQLAVMKVYTTALKSLESRAIEDYNLSLQIH